MSGLPKKPIVQDLPPKGGYPKIAIEHRPALRDRNGTGKWAIFGIVTFMTFSTYLSGLQNIQQREQEQKARDLRTLSAPIAKALEDQELLVGEIKNETYEKYHLQALFEKAIEQEKQEK